MASTDPLLELQGAIYEHLVGDDSPALIDVAVYDRVPEAAAFPYVSFGPADALSDDADCLTSFEVTFQLDVWSREPGFPQVKRIARQVRDALHDTELPLTDNALVSLQHQQTRVFRDPDGVTSHAALTFFAIIDQP